MPFPKVTDWSDEVYNAGTRGAFNPLRDLEKELHRTIPDLRPYIIMLCSEEDLNSATQMGWKHMDSGHFDAETVDDFNRKVGLRFGMTLDVHSHIKIGGNYIMLMPKTYREKVNEKRHEALLEQRHRANMASAYAHPSDKNYKQMLEAAQEISEKQSTTYRVQASGEPDRGGGEDKRGPGRPRKT
jgi:hypothetical protein